MGFTPDQRGMYYTDTRRREIYLFDYQRDSGALTNQRVFVRVPENEGKPDGLTVDAEGFVWSARWDGGCIVRYAPDGREVLRVDFPARRVSSLTFGGADYRDLYVTTAGGDDRAQHGPAAGALFVLRPGPRGVAEFASRIAI
jgi:D-xylonolactonase